MTPHRRFALGLTAAVLVVGAVRGMVVSRVVHLGGPAALWESLGQMANACIWIPVGLAALAVLDRRRARTARYGLLVAIGTAAVVAEPAFARLLGIFGSGPPPYWRLFIASSDTNALFALTVVGAAAAVAARVRQLDTELAAARLDLAVSDTQLHVLTLQLHPHFLFNALNLVSQLAYVSIDTARRTIANLRSLLVESLRHSLHREARLDEELGFLRAYLEIQEARFCGRLFSATRVEPGVECAAVPHLLLQPLVENAIVHGLAHRQEIGHLEISARRYGSRLILAVQDDGVGLPAESRRGVGLTNTRLRLEQLFPNDHRLLLAPGGNGGAVVSVDIPFRPARATTISDDIFERDDEPVVDDAAIIATPKGPSAHWPPIVAAWAAIAVLWTELRVIGQRDAVWSTLFASGGVNAVLWMVLTPIVVRFARWADVAGRRSRRFIIVHACGAAVVATLHTGLWLAMLSVVRSSDYEPILHSVFGWMIWDAGAYVMIVAFTTRATVLSRIRDTRVTMAERRARLSEARVAALRLRLQPRVLLGTLDALERVVSIDAGRSEAAITRLGDLLRLLLTRAEQEWAEVDEEVEVLMAFLDVMNAWRPPIGHGRDPLHMVIEHGDGRIPAMLLPTLAAAVGGEVESVEVRQGNDSVAIELTAGQDDLDAQAFREISKRLAELYGGSERLVSGRLPNGQRFIRVELPARSATEVDLAGPQGRASA